MHWGPNRKESGANLRDEPRHTDTSGTGNAAVDGYTRRGRRPRYHNAEIVSEEMADMEEGFFSVPYSDSDDEY
jgi:hypothetical protein